MRQAEPDDLSLFTDICDVCSKKEVTRPNCNTKIIADSKTLNTNTNVRNNDSESLVRSSFMHTVIKYRRLRCYSKGAGNLVRFYNERSKLAKTAELSAVGRYSGQVGSRAAVG